MATVKSSDIIYKFLISLVCLKSISATITVFKDDKYIAEFSDEVSFYGEKPFEPINGLIVPAEPFDACSRIQTAPKYANFSSFVLITHNSSFGSDCRTVYKIRWAAIAGFDLAVIMDVTLLKAKKKKPDGEPKIHFVLSGERNNHNLAKDASADWNNIPAVIVDAETGAIILERYVFRNESSDIFWLRVTTDMPNYKYYIMLFAIVIVICFMVMLLFMICLLVKCIRERRRLRRNRLSTRQIRQLGTITYTNDNQYKTCAICLEDYEEGERLRLLPCQHMFHIKCIDPWLHDNRRTCPLCKRKIRVGQSCADNSSSDSDEESRSSSVNENARLIPSEETERNNARLQALAHVLINMMNQSTDDENEDSDRENNTARRPDSNSEDASLLDNAEQPATIGSVNQSGSEIFVDALAPSGSHRSGMHLSI